MTIRLNIIMLVLHRLNYTPVWMEFSHLHSQMPETFLSSSHKLFVQLFQAGKDRQWERALSFLDATAELNYMSQIVFMLFEDPSKVCVCLSQSLTLCTMC